MTDISNNIFTYISSLYGEKAAQKFAEFIKKEPVQYLRINSIKTDIRKISQKLLQTYSVETEKIPNLNNALKIKNKSDILGKTIEHVIGEYYIQSLSSMIPPLVLAPQHDDLVLDLCAAPGSKTTEIGEMMNNKGTLIANEIALDRVKMLVYNIDRMNLINAGVIHYKGEWLSKIYNEHFDKILVDAPCSGLGIVQKKGEVNNWWSLERAERLGDLQLRLLIAAIKMAKEGGEIVYSTCTLTPEENEFIIDKAIQKYPVEIEDIELPIQSQEGFTSYNGKILNPAISRTKRILPWEVDSDGFFIAKLRKTGRTISPKMTPPNSKKLKVLSYDKAEIKKVLANIQEEFGINSDILRKFKYIIKRNDIYFIEKDWEENYPDIFERIGTRFGIIDKSGKVILHTQASQVLQNFIIRKIYEIEEPDELRTYLDGGTIKNKIAETGQCVVKYKDKILGTAIVTSQGIKSRFPRSKRTQEILIQ